MQIESTKLSHNAVSQDDLVEEQIAKICNFKDEQCVLSEALKHHFESGGSRTRANFTFKFARNFLIPKSESVYLACIPELLHNASLIHDDLQDLDDERRDNLSVWIKFGPDIAICAGDFLISCAYQCAGRLSLKNKDLIIDKTHEYIHSVIRGQVSDLSQDKNQTLVDADIYEEISKQKSGPLLAMSLTLPLIYTNRLSCINIAEEAFYKYAVAYQIYDDIHDVEQDQAKAGVKSGLNIVTIMQKNGEQSGVLAACKLAQKRLSEALELASKLPIPSNTILEKEIMDMQKKIRFIGSH